MKQRFKKILIPIMAALILGGLTVMAQATVMVNKTVKLSVGKADTVNLALPASDVLVANPAIADVGSLRSNRLYIVGKTVGDTNVLAFDEQGNQLANINIQVRVDEQTLRDTVREFFPKENIELHTVNDSIILKGEVSNPSVANQVRDLIGRFVKAQGQTLVDLMTVSGEQQVMLKVKVLEVNRDVLREYGFSSQYNAGGHHTFASTPGVGLTSLTPFGTGGLLVDGSGRFGPFSTDLSGLERDGLINTLAEPTLTAISGETAGFLAGGEYPVPTGRDNQGNVTIEFKQFGVSLNFSPTVMSSDRISLQLSTEVSEKSDQNSVTLVNTIIPGLTVRRAQTTVQMGSGGTMMIAGLMKSNTVDSMNGFPGLKDMPIIGELFKSKSFQRGESELVILVTPFIVQPYEQAQAERITTGVSDQPSRIIQTSAPVLGNPSVQPIPVSSPVRVPVKKAYYAPQGDQRTAGQQLGFANDNPSPAAAVQMAQTARTAAPARTAAAEPQPVAAPVVPVTSARIENTMPAKVAAPVASVQPVVKSRTAGTAVKSTAAVAQKTDMTAHATQADPLSSSFMMGLKKVYGKKAPSALGAGGSYGYIVD